MSISNHTNPPNKQPTIINIWHVNIWHVNVYVIIRTYPQFYHDLITMRGAMPTHLGANPRNHVNHDYSCSSLDTLLLLFGIAASTLFGKCLTVKNVRCTWYRLSNITVYSFHALSPILFFYNSKILVKPFIHSPIPRFPFFLLTRKSWLSLHPRTSLNPRVPFSQILDPSKIWYR